MKALETDQKMIRSLNDGNGEVLAGLSAKLSALVLLPFSVLPSVAPRLFSLHASRLLLFPASSHLCDRRGRLTFGDDQTGEVRASETVVEPESCGAGTGAAIRADEGLPLKTGPLQLSRPGAYGPPQHALLSTALKFRPSVR